LILLQQLQLTRATLSWFQHSDTSFRSFFHNFFLKFKHTIEINVQEMLVLL
jgi:hypothetical protein